jgi:class 3 adenylate cyclase
MGEEMKVWVFSKAKNAPFSRPGRAGEGVSVEALPLHALGRTLPTLGKGSLVYLDVAGLGPRERIKRLGLVSDHPELLFGIIDFTGSIPDPALLFRRGVVDYLGRPMAREIMNAKRVREVVSFARAMGREACDTSEENEFNAARGWDEILEGRTYPFFFLFIEVDDAEDMKRRHGAEPLARALETFRSFVERCVSLYGGKLWTWAGFGGIALFPYAEDNYAPLVCALRVLLWLPFYDVEESPLPNSLCFRMALSSGPMTYREKKTGAVISDALNSVFHLGQRFTEPGSFSISAEVHRLAPDFLKNYCVPAGIFEGRKIFRMRTPVYPSMQRDGEWSRES